MDAKARKEMVDWAFDNYRKKTTSIGVTMKLNKSNIGKITVELEVEDFIICEPIKGTYKGIYDNAFFLNAKIHIDNQLLEKIFIHKPSLKRSFLHLLN